jgi:glycosyltransferase involved in cell wall biosynthesis
METETKDAYPAMIVRLRATVEKVIPRDATVIVVSKGDDELLKLNGRRAWHFPQREDGVYAGYNPADSAAAITHLETLRANGGEFLVFPRTAAWWLEHYKEFRRHLEGKYRPIECQEDACLIFALLDPESRQEQSLDPSRLPAHQASSRLLPESGKALTDYVDPSLIEDLRTVFDFDYYSEQAATVFPSSDSALIDYLQEGSRKGYNPHTLFDTAYYLDHYPDVKRSGANPLIHFLSHGTSGGHNPHPLFDTEFYYSQAAGLREKRVNALVDYLTRKAYANAPSPNPLFANGYYVKTYPDAGDGGSSPLVHYLKYGCAEKRYISCHHKNIVDKLLQPSKSSLLRGRWKSGNVLLFSDGASLAGGLMIREIAQGLARQHRLNCLVVLFKRQQAAAEVEDHANVVVLDDFRLACNIFSPAALHMLIKTFCSINPRFAICDTHEVAASLKSHAIPSFLLWRDSADSYSKEVLENLFHHADRVILPSSADFHSIGKKIGHYPTNVALRPHAALTRALPDTGREETRERLARSVGLNKEHFIVLGYGANGRRDGFDVFLAAAQMARKRRPDLNLAFVWVARKHAEPLSPADGFSCQEEIEKSGLKKVVFCVPEEEPFEEYFAAVDSLFLSSRGAYGAGPSLRTSAGGLPVVCFEGSMDASDVSLNGRFVVPYLDLDGVCERIQALCDDASRKVQAAKGNGSAGFSIDDYPGSLMELACRDFHLPEGFSHLEKKRAAKTTRKIIIPCCGWGLSGVNTSLEAIGNELIRLGWDVEILFTRDRSAVISTAGSDAHLPQIPYRYLEPDNPGIDGMWEGLAGYLETNAPCIMWTAYDFIANGIVPALTEKVGVVAWVQADDNDYYEQAYRLGRYCNALVCVSRRIKEGIMELNPLIGAKAHVIANTSAWKRDIAGRKLASSEKARLIYTGRLVQHQKRVLDFIDLARSLDRTGIAYQLTLMGDFPSGENTRQLFESRAKAHLADGRISLPGRVPREKVIEALGKHDLFILLSDFEGLPLSLIEAMAGGCVPVVAAMESGIPEVITSGENGLVVSGRDYGQWASLLADLWRNAERLSLMSEKARETVRERFTVEHVGKQFDELFRRVAEEVCAGAHKRPPCLNWGEKRSRTGDVLPPPSMYRPPPHSPPGFR